MWIRRAFFRWLIPAAFVLPLWLFIGWGVSGGGGWAFLWMLFLGAPVVFLGQLVLALLVRVRPTVRVERAVSWWDVAGFGVWHALTIALGFYAWSWWAAVFVLTVLVGVGLAWSTGWQLWRERRPSGVLVRTDDGTAYIPPPSEPVRTVQPEIIVVRESSRPS